MGALVGVGEGEAGAGVGPSLGIGVDVGVGVAVGVGGGVARCPPLPEDPVGESAQAKLRGLSLRALTRKLSIHGNTVRRVQPSGQWAGPSSEVERRGSPLHSAQLRVQPVHRRLGPSGPTSGPPRLR